MKIRKTISKSSMELFNLCQLRYFYEYILKRRSSPSIATEIGTAVHAIAEVLGQIKIAEQNKRDHPLRTAFGEITWDERWLEPRMLTTQEVDLINKQRSKKKFFSHAQILNYGHIVEGYDFIQFLIDLAFDKYLVPLDATPEDKMRVTQYTWMLIEQFDIRKKEIVNTEFKFEVPIKEKWAELDDGYITLLGFIDLISRDNGILEISDYKTGQRTDFLTGKVKDYKSIEHDLQLNLYHLALSKYYQEDMIANLIYIRDGGVFTITFPDASIKTTERKVKQHITQVKNCRKLKLLDPKRRDWRCRYTCPAYKNHNFSDKCDCEFLNSYINRHGQNKTEETFKKAE